jgi:peptide/nickel transport system substrate-binding protein
MFHVRSVKSSGRSSSRTSWAMLAAAAASVTVVLAAGLSSAVAAPAAKAHSTSTTLRIAESIVQPTLDPATDIQYQSDELSSVYDRLVSVAPGGKILPDLATSWKAGKTSITFQLRKGVKFQDGTPFNAQAVKAELDRIANPKTQATNSKSVLGPYRSSKVLGPYTIRISWFAPYAGALIDFGNADLSIPSPKAAAAGILATHPVGTGPYEFVSYTPGTELVLQRNPGYTSIRPDLKNHGAAKYDRLVFEYVTDESTRANLLSTGGVDLTRLDGTYARSAMANGSLAHYVFPTISEYASWLNFKKFPDKRVRQAIFASIDRRAIVAAVASGFGQLTSNAIPTTVPGYSKSVAQTTYDQAKAKSLLAAAGYKPNSKGVMEKDGKELSFEILSASQDPWPAVDQLVQDQLSQVGIKTNIVTQVQASVTVTRRQGAQGMYIGTYGILDPMGSMQILFSCGKIPTVKNPLGTNFTFWCDRQYDRNIIAAQKQLGNEPLRDARLVAAQKLLMDANVVSILYQPQMVVFGSKSVTGVSLQPDGLFRINDLGPGS